MGGETRQSSFSTSRIWCPFLFNRLFLLLSCRHKLSGRPSPLRGTVQLLHLPGDLRGACLHTMWPQLLQGLPAGLLEPQQEVYLPHVQEELLQKTRDERQQGPGWNCLPVPGANAGRRSWRGRRGQVCLTGIHTESELRYDPRGLPRTWHWRVCPAWRGSLRCLHREKVKGAEVLSELSWVILWNPPQTSQKGQFVGLCI